MTCPSLMLWIGVWGCQADSRVLHCFLSEWTVMKLVNRKMIGINALKDYDPTRQTNIVLTTPAESLTPVDILQ